MNSHHFVHRHVAHIDIDEEIQGEVKRFIERIDRQVEQWSQVHSTAVSHPVHSSLILDENDIGDGGQA
jgi:hypothetical protein